MKKRVWPIMLVLLLAVCLTPVTALAASPVEKADITENGTAEETSVITYGSHEWYVIDNDEGQNRLYLFCTDKIFGPKYGLSTSDNGHPYSGIHYSSSSSTDYSGSLLQAKLAQILEWDFTSGEQKAIIKRTLDGTTDAVKPTDQALWPLSIEEARALNEDEDMRKSRNPDHWWMRSGQNGYVWFADAGGDYYADYTPGNRGYFGVRPAFYLDTSHVAFISNAEGGKASSGDRDLTAFGAPDSNRYKLTLLDTDRSNFSISNAVRSSNKIKVGYLGAVTGENEYISAVITDDSDNILYYGRVKHLTDAGDASGSVTFAIPKGISLGKNAVLKLFNEQYNGDNKTDYSSDLKNVPCFELTASGTGVTVTDPADNWFVDGGDYGVTLSAEKGYALPGEIAVKVGGVPLAAGSYSYNSKTGELIIPAELITGEVEIIAEGKLLSYSITYHLMEDGAVNDPDNPAAYTIHSPEIQLKAAVLDGRKFQGWFTSKGYEPETKVTKIAEGSTGNIELYAKWSEDVAPATGDDFTLWPWAFLAGAGLAGAITAARKKSRA